MAGGGIVALGGIIRRMGFLFFVAANGDIKTNASLAALRHFAGGGGAGVDGAAATVWPGDWIPYPLIGGRPYGVFQQVNLLASFTATGLALALMLFLLPDFSLRAKRYEKLRLMLLALLLAVFPALLVWLQSRIGWLGGGAAALLFIVAYAKNSLSTVLLRR